MSDKTEYRIALPVGHSWRRVVKRGEELGIRFYDGSAAGLHSREVAVEMQKAGAIIYDRQRRFIREISMATREDGVTPTAEIFEQAAMAYGDLQFREDDISFGKWNYKGGQEVFAGSTYLGYVLNGRFVADRRRGR